MSFARLPVMLAFTLPAWSAVVFTNLGPGDSYSNSSSSVYSGSYVAANFMPSVTGTLDSIRLPLISFGGPPDNLLISLRAPGTDPIGAVLESWLLTPADVTPDTGSIEVLLSSLHPALAAGSTYWLRLESTTPNFFQTYGWPGSLAGDTDFAISIDQALTWQHLSGVPPFITAPAFEVNATPAAIPEPMPILPIGAGLLAMLLRRAGMHFHNGFRS